MRSQVSRASAGYPQLDLEAASWITTAPLSRTRDASRSIASASGSRSMSCSRWPRVCTAGGTKGRSSSALRTDAAASRSVLVLEDPRPGDAGPGPVPRQLLRAAQPVLGGVEVPQEGGGSRCGARRDRPQGVRRRREVAARTQGVPGVERSPAVEERVRVRIERFEALPVVPPGAEIGGRGRAGSRRDSPASGPRARARRCPANPAADPAPTRPPTPAGRAAVVKVPDALEVLGEISMREVGLYPGAVIIESC